jgi:hypothetical protein
MRAQLEAAVTANLDWAAANHTLTEERDAAVLDAKKWEIAARLSDEAFEAAVRERDWWERQGRRLAVLEGIANSQIDAMRARVQERYDELKAEREANMTGDEIREKEANLSLLREILADHRDVDDIREREASRSNSALVAERDALLDLRDKAAAWRDVGTGSAANLIDQARVHNALRRAVAAVDVLGDVTPRSE